jgi:hypothetical protein
VRSPSDLPVAARLAGFAMVLTLSFGAAFGIGRAVGPVDRDEPAADHGTTPGPHDGDLHGGDHGGEQGTGS